MTSESPASRRIDRLALRRTFSDLPFVRLVYVTAGYPSANATVLSLIAIQRSGSVDVVELGVPFSDPSGDGPVIEQCSQRALAKGDVVSACDAIERCLLPARAAGFTLPVVVMGYMNTLAGPWLAAESSSADVASPAHTGSSSTPMPPLAPASLGPVAFPVADDCCVLDAAPNTSRSWLDVAAGSVSGVIAVDLPPTEPLGVMFRAACLRRGVSVVPLVTPLTVERRHRLEAIVGAADSFLYSLSALGVTGARSFVSSFWDEYRPQLLQISAAAAAVAPPAEHGHSDGVGDDGRATLSEARPMAGGAPVIVGFGISDAATVAAVRQTGARGCVIGSAAMSVMMKADADGCSDTDTAERLAHWLVSVYGDGSSPGTAAA
eukprot:TRINITY_DN71874_c0_g1_i1.p1 TRINITY_DN71874_c0_g1~~TRINITY_DN71874_c0_g1_i1.p1  ORF type:complete len:378 (-),score=38.69 TRINITY_DN71874_c0_g1_i1:112-1245(-)